MSRTAGCSSLPTEKELDEQIEQVFQGVSETMHRARSGADLVQVLNTDKAWLIGSLIHKFGPSEEIGEQDLDAYPEEIKRSLPKGFRAKGEIFVFLDECHRTQSGKLHDAMKALLPGAIDTAERLGAAQRASRDDPGAVHSAAAGDAAARSKGGLRMPLGLESTPPNGRSNAYFLKVGR